MQSVMQTVRFSCCTSFHAGDCATWLSESSDCWKHWNIKSQSVYRAHQKSKPI